MDRREREHDRPRDLGTNFGDFGDRHLVDVEQDVLEPEAAAAVAVELSHPGIHQRIRRHAEGGAFDRMPPRIACAAYGDEKVKTFPWIFPARTIITQIVKTPSDR